jgi:hypothetical protein
MSFALNTILTIFLCLEFSSVSIAQSVSTSRPQFQMRLGHVKDGDIGCGCAFSRNKTEWLNRRYIYVEGMDEPAYINLNGRNIKLHPVASSEESGAEKVGQRSWETYTADSVKIRLEKTVTKVCDPNDESCEVTYYKATMILTHKGQKLSVKLIGSCGC